MSGPLHSPAIHARSAAHPAGGSGAARVVDHSHLWVVPRDESRLRQEIEHQLLCKAPFHRELLRAVSECRARRVLEVGAGSAIDSFWLASHADVEAHALDAVSSAASFARRAGRFFQGEVRLHRADAHAAPFRDGSFDLLFHQGLLEHFADPLPLLRENLRLLRPGGLLVIDVPQTRCVAAILKHRRMRKGTWPWGWEREFTPREMGGLASGLPLALERLSGWGYDRYSAILRWPWAKVRRRIAPESPRLLRAFAQVSRRRIEPIWEGPWRRLEDRYGPWFMANVTGVYRRLP